MLGQQNDMYGYINGVWIKCFRPLCISPVYVAGDLYVRIFLFYSKWDIRIAENGLLSAGYF